MCANDETPANVNALNPSILRIDFGSWCLDPAVVYTHAKWIISISPYEDTEAYTTLEHIRAAKLHACYTGMWHLGNEPDIAHMPVDTYVEWLKTMIDLIRSGDSQAQFWIAGGSQLRPPFSNQWTPKVWNRLPDNYKKRIKGFFTHYYVDNPAENTLNGYLKEWNRWRNLNAAGREILLSECGVAVVDYVNPYMATYPTKVADFCERHNIWGWCWYSQSKTDGYMPLQDEDGNTPPGVVFNSMLSSYL